MRNNSNTKIMKGKILLLFIIFILISVVLMGKIIAINFFGDSNYRQTVLRQEVDKASFSNETLIPKRGSILDRRNIPLAESTVVYNIFMDSTLILSIEDHDKLIEHIGNIAGMIEGYSTEDILAIIDDEPKNKHKVLLKGKTYKDVEQIIGAIDKREAMGVFYEESYVRNYPFASLGANILGYTKKNGEGAYGLEEFYDSVLYGQDGRVFGSMTENQEAVQENIEAIPGHNLVLNVDFRLQEIVEQSIQNFFVNEMAKDVRVIMMDPRDGAVLAMAQYPSFDPNQYQDTSQLDWLKEQIELPWEAYSDPLAYIQKNRNVSDLYEPGSTFKALTVAMAYGEKIVDENTSFYCDGFYQAETTGKKISCWKRGGHGEQDLLEALANSCNDAMMQIAKMVWDEKGKELIYEYEQAFGVGSITGIDSIGENKRGATSGLKSFDQFVEEEVLTNSFGQGLSVTPLQLITGFSALINGGNLYQPRILDKIVDEKGDVVKVNSPLLVRKIISEEVSDYIRFSLRNVVDEGTGMKAQIEGYSIGGKTGTAQQFSRNDGIYYVSFMGFSPAENPEVICLVVVNEPVGYDVNSRYAAGIFKEIMEVALPYLKISKVYDPSSPDLEIISGDSPTSDSNEPSGDSQDQNQGDGDEGDEGANADE